MFPAKPIRVVVPYAPGGVIDATAGLVAEKLSESLGQAVVVDNRAGIGAFVAASTPPAIVAKLQEAMAAGIGSPELRSKLGQQGIDPVATATDEFNRFWKQDVEKYARTIRAAGVEADN
jgi:tripartite-type tricarboxylate transporter receptor subunit TctC